MEEEDSGKAFDGLDDRKKVVRKGQKAVTLHLQQGVRQKQQQRQQQEQRQRRKKQEEEKGKQQ